MVRECYLEIAGETYRYLEIASDRDLDNFDTDRLTELRTDTGTC